MSQQTDPSRFVIPKKMFWCGAFVFGIVSVILGMSLMRALDAEKDTKVFSQIKPLREQTNTYTYINPLLGYELPDAVKAFKEYRQLSDQVQSNVNTQLALHHADAISVYFRDLTEGRWLGINENSGYEPASMLKVVVMIAYLKEAEGDSALLDHKYPYTKAESSELSDVPFQSPSGLAVGQMYSVNDLINAMIIHSDNGAKNVLLMNIDGKVLDGVFTDLGLKNPVGSPDYRISPKAYSLFLRVLYNATYLSRAMSEEALHVLSLAQYPDGLAGGVPTTTPIAQKFGESVYSSTSTGAVTGVDLSNCGIVYHPQTPYIVCVMTHGSSPDDLASVIRGISQIIYHDIDVNYQKVTQ